jgi:heat shock protein HtpX
MDRDEIEGVLGHELTHVANGDMVTMTLLQGVINAFVIFFSRILAAAISGRGRDGERSGGNWMLVMLLQTVLSFLGMFVVAWFSRQREYRADAGGAAVAGRGKMVGALQSLQRFYERGVEDTRGAALSTLKISGRGGMFALLSTHPPLEERIARLQAAET